MVESNQVVKIALMKDVAGPVGSAGIDVQSDKQNSQGSKPSDKEEAFPFGGKKTVTWCT